MATKGLLISGSRLHRKRRGGGGGGVNEDRESKIVRLGNDLNRQPSDQKCNMLIKPSSHCTSSVNRYSNIMVLKIPALAGCVFLRKKSKISFGLATLSTNCCPNLRILNDVKPSL